MLVAFTGCDGCGKSTQIARAQQWLLTTGTAAHIVNKWQIMNRDVFPECRFISGSIDDFRKCIAEMDEPARTLLAFWPIMMTAQRIEKQKSEFDVFLADGYWMKVAAAELAYGSSPRLVQACVEQMRQPDLTLFLDAPPEQMLQRKIAANLLTPYECGRDESLSHEKYLAQQRSISVTLRQWAEQYGWQVINAAESADHVWGRVRETLEHQLRKRGVLFHFPRSNDMHLTSGVDSAAKGEDQTRKVGYDA